MFVQKIEEDRGCNKLYRIVFDENFSILVSMESILKFGISVDSEFSEEDVLTVLHYEQYIRAKADALHLLSYRIRSEKEVSDTLRRKQHSEHIIEEVLLFLREQNYLDDGHFATVFAHEKSRLNHYSSNRIAFELKVKGIDPAIIHSVVNDIASEDFQNARKSAHKKFGFQPPEDSQKVFQFLSRKGFSYDVIKKVLTEWCHDEEE